MSRELQQGSRIKLKRRIYVIKEIIGRGASCVVYRAVRRDKTEHLLKEYNPRHIAMYRESTGELCLESEEDCEEFEAGLARFREGHIKQRELRLDSDLKNSTSNVQGIYKANGTEYIDMTCFSGKTYDQVQEKSVYDLLRRMKALAQVIGNYHKVGLLHLDIKPENIFTLPETCEMVMLFDFDSVVSRESAAAGGARSYTLSWAAPEQTNPLKRNTICEATDIFAVGEMIFYQLMGKARHSNTEERFSFAEYHFDRTLPIFENINPKVFPLLEELLHKTICVSIKQRYRTIIELIAKLDEIIKIANPEAPFLAKKIPYAQAHFVGRIHEIETIHELLAENGTVFISGVGGIGKSELVKKYAEKYHSSYDSITFVPFETDIATTISQAENLPYNVKQHPNENAEEYFADKAEKLRKLCNERTLIVLDNFDVTDDPNLKLLVTLGCKVLITTRSDFSDVYAQLLVDAVEEPFEIFKEHYPKTLTTDEQSCVGEIIEIICGHTLTVELLAKQMMAGRVGPKQMLARIESVGIGNAGKEKVRHIGKNGDLIIESAYGHVQALFDLSHLVDKEQYVLTNLSVVPYTGISTELFHNWCELDDYDCINQLVAEGWIQQDKDKDYISLHPVVSEIVQNASSGEEFSSLFKNITNRINSEDEGEVISAAERLFLESISLQIMRAIRVHRYSTNDASSILLGIGNLFYRNIKYELAESAFYLALEVRKDGDIQNSYGDVLCRASVGLMLATMGSRNKNAVKIQEGITLLHECLKVLTNGIEGHDDLHEEICEVYNYLAMAYEDLPDVDKAIEMYKLGLNMLESLEEKQVGDYLGIAIYYNNLGYLYENSIVDFDSACENYEKSLTYYRLINSKSSHIIKALYHLGMIYADEQYTGYNLSKANLLSKEAMPIAEELFDCEHSLHVHTLYLYGKTELLLGNEKTGKESLQRAYDVYRKNLKEDNPRIIWLKKVLA